MTDESDPARTDRPALPRDAFRAKRIGVTPDTTVTKPVVVTPIYDDIVAAATAAPTSRSRSTVPKPTTRVRAEDGPFAAYGRRSSSRPYALRLPDAIDLALRQIAAEERTHPLRIIDRILYDHLHAIGKLPSIEVS